VIYIVAMKTLLIFAGICSGMAGFASLVAGNSPTEPLSDPPKGNSELLEIFKKPRFSAAGEQVVKLVRSGADANVIQSYVRNLQVAYRLSADEIIHLRSQGVSNPVISAMIERGAELSNQTLKSQPLPAQQPQPSPVTTTYGAAPTVTTYTAPQPVSTVTYIGSGYSYYNYPRYCYPYYYHVSYPRYWYGYPWTYHYSRPRHYGWPRGGFGYSFGGLSYHRGPVAHGGYRGGHRGRH